MHTHNLGKLAALLLAGSIMSGAWAATEITFTGGDASNPTNLSSSANWSAAPGAETIGIIDLSQTSAQGYVVNSDLALSGLRIRSNSGKAVTIAGAGTLTIGADGYVAGAKGNLTLQCPLATSANQVWDFKQANFTTGSTISGSDEMVISNYTYCVHSSTVNYGGTLKYYAYSSAANKWVSYRGTGKWATHVITASGPSELYHVRAADIRYADVFPSGCDWTGGGYPRFLSVCATGSGYVVFDDGDTLETPRASMLTAVVGHFEQRGGRACLARIGGRACRWPRIRDAACVVVRAKDGATSRMRRCARNLWRDACAQGRCGDIRDDAARRNPRMANRVKEKEAPAPPWEGLPPRV